MSLKAKAIIVQEQTGRHLSKAPTGNTPSATASAGGWRRGVVYYAQPRKPRWCGLAERTPLFCPGGRKSLVYDSFEMRKSFLKNIFLLLFTITKIIFALVVGQLLVL